MQNVAGFVCLIAVGVFFYSIFAFVFAGRAPLLDTRPKATFGILASFVVFVLMAQLLPKVPAPEKVEVPAAPKTAMTDDARELLALDNTSLNDLPPFKGLPEPPVIRACFNDAEGLCDSNRLQFYHAWVDAWKGDYQGQRNVAFMLSHQSAGVQTNPIQGCAWRIVIIASGHTQNDTTDTANLKNECNKLSDLDAVAAKQAAKSIQAKIKER